MSIEDEARARWKITMGNPQSLREAIDLGLADYLTSPIEKQTGKIFEVHIKNYLAQKFAPYIMGEDSRSKIFQVLWDRVIGEKK